MPEPLSVPAAKPPDAPAGRLPAEPELPGREDAGQSVILGTVVGLIVIVLVLLWPVPWTTESGGETLAFVTGPGALWAMCWVLLGTVAATSVVWTYGRVTSGRDVAHIVARIFLPLDLSAGREEPSSPWRNRVTWPIVVLLLWGPILLGVMQHTSVLSALLEKRGKQPVASMIPVADYEPKFWLLFYVCVSAAMGYLYCLRRINGSAASVASPGRFTEDAPNAAQADALATLTRIARDLRTCLLGLGTLLTLLVISSATQRLALLAIGKKPEAVVDVQQVLSYGLYYSFVLLVIYVPVHVQMLAHARRVVEGGYPLDGGLPHEVLKRRDDTLKFIGLSGDWPEVVRSSVFVLAPLLAALFAQAFPK